jgi:hypothetical protein
LKKRLKLHADEDAASRASDSSDEHSARLAAAAQGALACLSEAACSQSEGAKKIQPLTVSSSDKGSSDNDLKKIFATSSSDGGSVKNSISSVEKDSSTTGGSDCDEPAAVAIKKEAQPEPQKSSSSTATPVPKDYKFMHKGGGRIRLPDKLMEYLNKEVIPDTLWWQPDGDGFAFDSESVQTHFLDKHFRGTKLTSFIRSLNRW